MEDKRDEGSAVGGRSQDRKLGTGTKWKGEKEQRRPSRSKQGVLEHLISYLQLNGKIQLL